MTSRNGQANLPTAKPGGRWTAQDGNSYIVHSDGSTLIDHNGDYFSPFDLRPLPKHEIDTAHRYACFPDDIVDEIIAANR